MSQFSKLPNHINGNQTDENEKKQEHMLTKESVMGTLKAVLDEYSKNAGEKWTRHSEYKQKFEAFQRGELTEFPVYYSFIPQSSKSGDALAMWLSPACITREIYDYSLGETAGAFAPCSDKKKLCPACTLFGTLAKNGAVSSRLRFTDLEPIKTEDETDGYASLYYQSGKSVTLPVLSSPKLNNMEFYLEKPSPDAVFWTYEYYVDKSGVVHVKKGKLAGRKFYWHNLISQIEKAKPIKTRNGSYLNISVRPVDQNVEFKGDIYFEALSKQELNILLYIITAGDERRLNEKEHGYKLGAGKPFGLGSVICEVVDVTTREYEIMERSVKLKERHHNLENVYKEETLCNISESIIDNFEKMTDLNILSEGIYAKIPVSYPAIEAGQEIYQWFTENHKMYDRQENTIKGMAKARKEMMFVEYLEAMEPILQPTLTQRF